MQRRIYLAVLLAALTLALACARAETTGSRRYADDGAFIPKPPVMLVYGFALSADDVVLDTFGMRDSSADELNEAGRRVQNQLALTIVAALNDRGIPAQRAFETTEVPPRPRAVGRSPRPCLSPPARNLQERRATRPA